MSTSLNEAAVRAINKAEETLVEIITPTAYFDWRKVGVGQVSRQDQLRFNQAKDKTQDHHTRNAVEEGTINPT